MMKEPENTKYTLVKDGDIQTRENIQTKTNVVSNFLDQTS